MLQVEIEGTIIKALELRSGISARNGNEWRRQDYVIETPATLMCLTSKRVLMLE